MSRELNFRYISLAGIAVTMILVTLIAVTATTSLRVVTDRKESLFFEQTEDLLLVERMRILAEREVSSGRGYLVTGQREFLDKMNMEVEEFVTGLRRLEERLDGSSGREILDEVLDRHRKYRDSVDSLVNRNEFELGREELGLVYDQEVRPQRDVLDEALIDLSNHKREVLEAQVQGSMAASERAVGLVSWVGSGAVLLTLLFSAVVFFLLDRIYGEARAAVRTREEIVSIVSHDLKNPLGAILLALGILKRRLLREGADGKVVDSIGNIENSARRMSRMIDDLLDLSRIQAGTLPIQKEIFDLKGLAVEIVEQLRPIAERKQLALDSVAGPPLKVIGDRDRIAQVVSNLVGNAIKFTPDGGRIAVRIQSEAGRAQMSVADSGPGISREHLPHVFEKLWQAPETAAGGTGLGLYIARGIVDAHGGQISVDSRTGEGSEFRFTIPLAPSVPGGVQGQVPEGRAG
jgi:signal transduction histidine kinase